MGFQQAVETVFSKYADFSGRARRSEYWYFFLFNVLVYFVISLLGIFLQQWLINVLSGIYSFAVLIPTLAVSWRRLHDTGRSGLWFLLTFIPIGQIVYIVFLCLDSQPGSNQYGPNPKDFVSYF